MLSRPYHPYTQGLLRSDAGLIARDFPLASLPGSAPLGEVVTKGCAFAERCPHAMEICRIKLPPAMRVTAGGYECVLRSDEQRAARMPEISP